VNPSAAATPVPALRSPVPIVVSLNAEWHELVASWPPEPADWAGRHGALAGGGLVEVVERAATGDDAVLLALLVESGEGSELAGRTVLQAMLGRLVRMARRDRWASVDDYVGALWCVLRSYPLDRRPVRIAANLALDTLKTVQRDRRWCSGPAVDVWLPGEAWDAVLEQGARRQLLDHAAEQQAVAAADLIDAGRRLRLVDEDTSRLLRHVYVDGLSGREAAARLGTTPGSLRVRCSRAVRRLAGHLPALVEAA
jgi:sigma-70-like protein